MPRLTISLQQDVLERCNTVYSHQPISNVLNGMANHYHQMILLVIKNSGVTYNDWLVVMDAMNGTFQEITMPLEASGAFANVVDALVGNVMDDYEFDSIDDITDEMDGSHHLVSSRKASLQRLSNLSPAGRAALGYISSYWWGLKSALAQNEWLFKLTYSSAINTEQRMIATRDYLLNNHPQFKEYDALPSDQDVDGVSPVIKPLLMINEVTGDVVCPIANVTKITDLMTCNVVDVEYLPLPVLSIKDLKLMKKRNEEVPLVSDIAFNELKNSYLN